MFDHNYYRNKCQIQVKCYYGFLNRASIQRNIIKNTRNIVEQLISVISIKWVTADDDGNEQTKKSNICASKFIA